MIHVSLLAAVWALVSPLLLKGRHFADVTVVDSVFWALNVPVGYSSVDAVLLLLFAMAVSRRKRIALWIFLAVEVLGAIDAITVIVDPGGSIRIIWWSALVGLLVALVTVPLALSIRSTFPGRIVPGSAVGALLILATGLGLNTLFGWLAVHALPLHHHVPADLVPWILARVFGSFSSFLVATPDDIVGPRWLGAGLSFWSIVVTLLALLYFLRARRMPGRTPADDLLTRRLLARWGSDSLGYFATRDDRSLIATTDERAAISYGVALGVSLAGGDPLGDPASWDAAIARWRAQCARYGWIPAAISASEAGARAYRRAGFVVRAMGDEAVIHTSRFDIASPHMRAVAQSVRRARRAGVTIQIRRLADIDEAERLELADAAERFRVGDERGFSMSLERILDPVDARTLVVSARGEDGAPQALLTFSPWGERGVSLTLMRRSPESVNGVVEAMVAALAEYGRDGQIERISLNFAMFRHLFDEGEAVDATWANRVVRRVLLLASRFWQLDSLYESNARYEPEWVTRYLCFPSVPELTQVLAAAGVLEGFLPQFGARTSSEWVPDEAHLAAVREIEEEAARRALEHVRRPLSDQERVRREKADRLAAAGMEPWPPALDLGLTPAQVRELVDAGGAPGAEGGAPGAEGGVQRTVTAGGRIRALRDHGGVRFVDIDRYGVRLQLLLDAAHTDERAWELAPCLDIGDLIVATGTPGRSRTGEPSLLVTDWRMAAKALRPLPARGTVLDARTRTRERVTHFLTDETALDLIRKRSRAFSQVRALLGERGYLEVETPMLHAVKGGANARPFITHLNAYGADVFLRIAPELHLKRLAVAGMDAVFEMGRSFRNEGADATHNPEFTSLEVYRAGGDYTTMRELTQELIQRAAVAVNGACVCWRPVGSPGAEDGAPVVAHVDGVDLVAVDISGEWPVVPVHEAISRAVGCDVTVDSSVEELSALVHEHGIAMPAVVDHGSLIGALYDELVEARTLAPTFYTDFPTSTSPLTRRHRRDPRLAERWDLVAFGMELGTAYTELTDPLDQRVRFEEQSLAAAAGDPEAMSIDTAFLDDLELGLAPTGGMGLGMDRLVMMLTGSTIRQVLAFPFVRPMGADGVVR